MDGQMVFPFKLKVIYPTSVAVLYMKKKIGIRGVMKYILSNSFYLLDLVEGCFNLLITACGCEIEISVFEWKDNMQMKNYWEKKQKKDDLFFYSVRVREYKQHEGEMVFTALFNALKL